MSETTLNENLVYEVGECQVCHRNVQHKRLKIKFLSQDAMAHIFNLERGFLYTFIELYRNPKIVMDNFISGAITLAVTIPGGIIFAMLKQ